MTDQSIWGVGVAVVLFVVWRAHERILPRKDNEISLEAKVAKLERIVNGLCVKAHIGENNFDEKARSDVYYYIGPASRRGRMLVRKAEGTALMRELDAQRKVILEDYPLYYNPWEKP